MKIAFLMLRTESEVRSPVTGDVIRHLREWGANVDVVYPEEQVISLNDVRVGHDLYVLKSRTELGLGYAGALDAAGATILNPYPVSARLRDKIALTALLRAADVPTPQAFVTAHPGSLAPLLKGGPLAVKPYRGSGTRGVHVVWDPEDLDDVPSNQGPVYAQRLVERDSTETKVYYIGEQIFGVKRPWPARTYADKCGTAFTVSPKLREITRRCAVALGIDAFALDIVGRLDDPNIVDVKSFPTFTGVPNAALRVADYVYDAAIRATRGQPKPAAVAGRKAS